MLERVIDDALAQRQGVIGGDEAFLLHDTYGFPLELTREIAGERGAAVDTVGFDRLMEEQRERARRDAAAKRDVVALADLPATAQRVHRIRRGSRNPTAKSSPRSRTVRPAARCRSGEEGTLILDRTSFYAERGGQIGDRGTIVSDGGALRGRATRSTWAKRSRTPEASSRARLSAGDARHRSRLRGVAP